MNPTSTVVGRLFSETEKLEKTMFLSTFCENVMHSQGNFCFFTKIKCIESSSVHCIMDFCKESNNVVKAILLYKISVKTSGKIVNFMLFDRKHTGLQQSEQKAKTLEMCFYTVWSSSKIVCSQIIRSFSVSCPA